MIQQSQITGFSRQATALILEEPLASSCEAILLDQHDHKSCQVASSKRTVGKMHGCSYMRFRAIVTQLFPRAETPRLSGSSVIGERKIYMSAI